MIRRPFMHKLSDIKNLRRLTSLLGKLDIADLYVDHGSQNPSFHRYTYGLTLRESMDMLDRVYFYYKDLSDVVQLRADNLVAAIKNVRRFIFVLNKLEIQSAKKIGLQSCKGFINRQLPD